MLKTTRSRLLSEEPSQRRFLYILVAATSTGTVLAYHVAACRIAA